jgi:prophage regulatory protein
MTTASQVRRALRLPEVLDALGIGRSKFYAGIATGKFPPGTKIDPDGRVVVWFDSEIAEIQARAIARRAVSGAM